MNIIVKSKLKGGIPNVYFYFKYGTLAKIRKPLRPELSFFIDYVDYIQ